MRRRSHAVHCAASQAIGPFPPDSRCIPRRSISRSSGLPMSLSAFFPPTQRRRRTSSNQASSARSTSISRTVTSRTAPHFESTYRPSGEPTTFPYKPASSKASFSPVSSRLSLPSTNPFGKIHRCLLNERDQAKLRCRSPTRRNGMTHAWRMRGRLGRSAFASPI